MSRRLAALKNTAVVLSGHLIILICQASDESFLEKTHHQHGKDPYYIRPRVKNGKFGVRHYAGNVMYTVSSA